MTADELEKQIDRAVTGFSSIDGMPEDLAQKLVEQGFLSYDDLSVIEPDQLMEMGDLSEEQVQHIVDQAEERATEAEEAAAAERRRQRELDRIAQGTDEVKPTSGRPEAGKGEAGKGDLGKDDSGKPEAGNS
jgi:N utilization substance protein A